MRSSAASTSAGGRPATFAADEHGERSASNRRRTAAGRRAARSRRCGSRARRASATRAVGGRGRRRAAAAARCPSIRAAPSSRTDWPTRPAATTPVAPAASATRTIAPRLPGSCTSTAMTTSGDWPPCKASVDGQRGRSASATIAARRSHRADRVHHRRRHDRSPRRPARRARRRAAGISRPFRAVRASPPRCCNAMPARDRIADQMRAVEQHHAAGVAARRRRGSAPRAGSGGW